MRALMVSSAVIATTMLLGCGSGAEPTPVSIDVEVTGDQVSPSGEAVNVVVGSEVTVSLTTDRDETLHVHGYGIEMDVAANETDSLSFIADKTGSYEVETHDPAVTVVKLVVR